LFGIGFGQLVSISNFGAIFSSAASAGATSANAAMPANARLRANVMKTLLHLDRDGKMPGRILLKLPFFPDNPQLSVTSAIQFERMRPFLNWTAHLGAKASAMRLMTGGLLLTTIRYVAWLSTAFPPSFMGTKRQSGELLSN